ncbi:MAG: DUF1573 domain-containing protein [Planctomycetaceae bacterium]|jgi:archaellum component FlaG (FlaF/FlaG flagellin family)|nr:DUF1573 domain-containing protein [Planctomycetaceae bacterium]
MTRTLLTAVLVSCVAGVLLGLGSAYCFLSIDAWEEESETRSVAKTVERAFAKIDNPNAKASIEETTHYFGVMDVKANGSHDFYVKNIGTADLVMMVDRTTCSCTGIEITPTRVAPGKTATCQLKYNAENALTGKFSQGGTIRTNDPENREILLMVQGVFTTPVVMQPSAVNFARVSAGTTRTATIRFYGFEDKPLQFTNVTWTDREHFDFQWKPAERTESDDADDEYLSLAKSVIEGTVTLKPGLPVGSFQEWIQIGTNYPSLEKISFLVLGQIGAGNISVSGQGYNKETGVVNFGRNTSREISIQISGASAPSALVQVKTVEPAWLRAVLSPPMDIGSYRRFSLTVEVPDDAPTGSYGFGGDGQQAYIMLETNDETMPVVRIPLQFAVGKQ